MTLNVYKFDQSILGVSTPASLRFAYTKEHSAHVVEVRVQLTLIYAKETRIINNGNEFNDRDNGRDDRNIRAKRRSYS